MTKIRSKQISRGQCQRLWSEVKVREKVKCNGSRFMIFWGEVVYDKSKKLLDFQRSRSEVNVSEKVKTLWVEVYDFLEGGCI